MVDEVRYELPLGLLVDIAHRFMVRGDAERIFAYRNACIPEIIK
jgi:hypothetical protein